MKNLKLTAILIISIFFIGSCSKDRAGFGRSTIKISAAANLMAGNGGLVIVGKKDNNRFSLVFNSTVSNTPYEIIVPNGNWKFWAMNWDGASAFEGNTVCDYKTQEIATTDSTDTVDVVLNLSAGKCRDQKFSDTNYLNSTGGNTPDKLTVVSCQYFPNGDSISVNHLCHEDEDGHPDGSNIGYIRGLRFRLISYVEGAVTGAIPQGQKLESNCFTSSTINSSIIPTDIRLPFFGELGANTKSQLVLFFDSSCSLSNADEDHPSIGLQNSSTFGFIAKPGKSDGTTALFLGSMMTDSSLNLLESLLPRINCTASGVHRCMDFNDQSGPIAQSLNSTGDQGSLMDSSRQAVWESISTPDALTQHESPRNQLSFSHLSNIRDALTNLGTHIQAGGLASNCSGIPTNNSSYTLGDADEVTTFRYKSATKTIPTGFTGASSSFDKRFELQGANSFTAIEISCAQKVGWMQSAYIETSISSSWEECYWDFEATNPIIECSSINETKSGGGTPMRHRGYKRLEKTGNNTWKLWYIQGVNTNDGGSYPPTSYSGNYTWLHSDASIGSKGKVIAYHTSGLDSDNTTTQSVQTDGGTMPCIDLSTDDKEACPADTSAIGTSHTDNGANAPALTSAFDGNSLTGQWLFRSTNTAPDDAGCTGSHLQCALTQFPSGFEYDI